jgi:hypothetical protein
MTTFMHDVPPDIPATPFARGEPRQSDTPFAEPWSLEQWPNVPTRVLAGRHDRMFPAFRLGLRLRLDVPRGCALTALELEHQPAKEPIQLLLLTLG